MSEDLARGPSPARSLLVMVGRTAVTERRWEEDGRGSGLDDKWEKQAG